MKKNKAYLILAMLTIMFIICGFNVSLIGENTEVLVQNKSTLSKQGTIQAWKDETQILKDEEHMDSIEISNCVEALPTHPQSAVIDIPTVSFEYTEIPPAVIDIPAVSFEYTEIPPFEFYKDDTSNPLDEDDIKQYQEDIDSIIEQVLKFYYEDIYEARVIKIYNLSPLKNWIVLVNEQFYHHVLISAYSYYEKELSRIDFYNYDKDGYFMVTGPMGKHSAPEINMHFGTGYPFPILEISAYSNMGNGRYFICRLNESSTEIICDVELNGDHTALWDDRREYFEETTLDIDDEFDCNFENWRQNIEFSDVNNDGYIDIILYGKYQCRIVSGDIIVSEDAIDVLVYNELTDSYVYSNELSIQSPMRQYWGTSTLDCDMP